MPLRTASGYALRSIVLGEADLIVDFYTRELGRVRAVARHARHVRSRFGSALQLMTRSRLLLYRKENADLGRLSSCEIEQSFYRQLAGPEEAAIAAYLAELLIEFAPEHDPMPAIYRLVGVVMEALAAGLSGELSARYFEVWMLRLSGLLPRPDICGSCGRALAGRCWVADNTLEFICKHSCGSMRGRRWLSPAAVGLLQRILTNKPLALQAEANGALPATRRLGAVLRIMIAGHLDKSLGSWRYEERMRRYRRRFVMASGS